MNPSRKRLCAVAFAAALCAGCKGDPQATKQRYLASADAYAAEGRLAEAVIQYRNAVQADPSDGETRARLAHAYLETGQPGLALEELVRAADLLPEDTDVQLDAGRLLMLAGRFDDARVRASRVLEKDAANLDAQIQLANALAGLKDFDAAVAEIEEAIRLDPERGESYSNLGALELGRGRKEAAEQAFKKAVDIDDRSPAVHLALANFYWADARWSAAEQELRRVLEIAPDNVLAHRALAVFAIAVNRPADAEPHLKKVAELTKASWAALALADYYTAFGNRAAARSILDPIAQEGATAPQAGVRLAALDRAEGEAGRAHERLDRLLDADRTQLNALTLKSSLLLDERRLEEALSVASIAVQEHPTSASAFFALGRVQTARHQIDAAIAAFDNVLRLNPRATDAKVALARLHLAAGRPDTSVGIAREVIASEPRNAEARLAVARGLIAQRDLTKAEAELASLAARFPGSAAVQVQQGILRGLQRDGIGARRHFERALELDPDSTEALGGLVALDLSARRFEEAKARVERRLAGGSTDTALLLTAGRTYAAVGDGTRAEELLRKAISADPSHLAVYGTLAQLYVSQGRLDAALNEFEELAKRDSKPVGALTFAGIILEGQGKTAEAQRRFERALQIDPEAPVAANNLAWIYAQSDERIDLALPLAEIARRKLPESPEVNHTLGFIYLKKEQAERAISLLKTSVEKDPSNPSYHYHLGLALAKAGPSALARQHLTRALELKADFDGAQDARRTLAALP